jgi:hypothetical protein
LPLESNRVLEQVHHFLPLQETRSMTKQNPNELLKRLKNKLKNNSPSQTLKLSKAIKPTFCLSGFLELFFELLFCLNIKNFFGC